MAIRPAMNFVDEPYGWGLVFDGRSGSLHESAGEAKDYAINYADDVSYRAFPLYERAWISADDRLPPNDEYVACLTMSGRPIAARRDAAGWWTVFCTTPYSVATITHWMPLPAPPPECP
jgi:hypothetical protein